MRRICFGIVLLLILGLTACSSAQAAVGSYQPEQMKYDLQTYQEQYPLEYKDWAASGHGQAYLEGTTDAPACTDCHAEPEGNEIQSAAFQMDIPRRCARCHSDAEKMSQYEVLTDVYQTYLADYHGATVEYYRLSEPDAYRYEAVCDDCHGSHAIFPAEDERSSVYVANLQSTCQKCHHDAPANFATAYGHYKPARAPVSSRDSTIVFIVKLFYQAMIPVVMGGMVGYIGLDWRHRVVKKKKAVKQEQGEVEDQVKAGAENAAAEEVGNDQ